jgi:hypothetical protein
MMTANWSDDPEKRDSFRGSEHAALGFVVWDEISIARWRDGIGFCESLFVTVLCVSE